MKMLPTRILSARPFVSKRLLSNRNPSVQNNCMSERNTTIFTILFPVTVIGSMFAIGICGAPETPPIRDYFP